MPHLTIVANIHAKPDQAELVRSELEKLIPLTRAEEGCVQYDLHLNNSDPAHFLFFENWATRDAFEAHMKTAHIAGYLEATEGAVDQFIVKEMTKIGGGPPRVSDPA
jgi:quinol monooxygenase YgiN